MYEEEIEDLNKDIELQTTKQNEAADGLQRIIEMMKSDTYGNMTPEID
jgi:hypothetical protein